MEILPRLEKLNGTNGSFHNEKMINKSIKHQNPIVDTKSVSKYTTANVMNNSSNIQGTISTIDEKSHENYDSLSYDFSTDENSKYSNNLYNNNGSVLSKTMHSVAASNLQDKSKRNPHFHLQNPLSLSRKKVNPYVLNQIETYLSQHLPSEGAIVKKFVSSGKFKSNPEDLKLYIQLERFAVYRESFRIFANHFKMYKPILNKIRKEYDKKIDALIQDMEDVKEYEGYVKQEGENIQIKIYQLRQAHELKVKEIKEENKELDKKLRISLTEEQEMERKIQEMHFSIRELENTQKEEKIRAASLQDALQFSQDTVQKMKKRLEDSHVESESHAAVRKNYSESLTRLGMMDKMIRKEDHLKLIEKNKDEQENINKLTSQLNVMRIANKRMQEEIVRLKIEIEASENRNADNERQLIEAKKELLRTHTPRPDWQEVEAIIPDISLENESSVNIAKELERYIADVQERLEEQSETLKKQRKILSYLQPPEDEEEEVASETQQYFIGKGNGPDVPKYLRHTGKIKNKNLPKREVENLIQEVWKLRMKVSGTAPFDEVFETFLSTRYGNVPGVKSEWAYSIVDGCRCYRSDPDCDLFLSVLEGEVSEDTYKGQFEMIDKLRALFVKLDEKENTKITGFVKKKIINSALDKFFPGKSSDDLIKIKCMLHIQNPDPIVDYEKLFEEDRDHSQGLFVETIREQFLNEVQSYARDIDRAISSKAVKGKMTLLAVKQAFYDIDPLLQSAVVDSYISKALEHIKMEIVDRKAKLAVKEEAKDEINWKEEIDVQHFIKNLKKVLMIRRTKVEQIEEIKERNNKKKRKQQQQQPGKKF